MDSNSSEYYESKYSDIIRECERISLDITDVSRLAGEKRVQGYQRLLNELEVLREKSPENTIFELHSLNGLLLLRMGRQKAAIMEFQIAVKLIRDNETEVQKNDSAGVWYNMGIAYMELNLFDEAYQCFQSSLAIRPHNIKCFTSMAVVKQMQGNFQQSYDILCSVLKNESPQNSDIEKVFVSLGYTLFRSKNYKEALDCADKILNQVNSESEKALKLRGTVCHAMGNTKEAWDCCNELFRLSENSPEAHLLAGTLYSSEKSFRNAYTHYNKARKIGRSYSFTLFNSLATVLSKMQKFKMALRVYRYILETDQNPVHKNSVNRSIRFFENMANRKMTESMVRESREDSRKSLPAYEFYLRGTTALENGDVDEAFELLTKASESKGAEQFWEIDNGLGRIYNKRRNCVKAVYHFERAAEIAPKSILILHSLASSYAKNNEYQKSLDVIDRILEIQPDSPQVKKMRAVALSKLGKYDDSAEYLTEFLEKDPQDAYTLVSMGRVWQEKGEYVKAHECFVKLLEKEPANEQAIVSIAINYSRSGNIKYAVQFVQSNLRKNPQSYALNLTMGNIYRFHKRYSDAEVYYKKCNCSGYNREVFEGLADCICQMRRLDEALSYYNQIAENEKGNNFEISALKSVAFIYRLKKEFSKALEIYERIDWENDYFFATWQNVAQCYAGMANQKKNAETGSKRGANYFSKALKLYKDIKEREKNNPQHCERIDFYIAELYTDKGEYGKACEIYKGMINGNSYHSVWKNYANCLMQMDLHQEALDVCNMVSKKFEENKNRRKPEELLEYQNKLEQALEQPA